MNRLIAIISICALILSLGLGCASQEAYRAHVEAMVKANAYRQQPGITQEFDADGRLTKQSIIMPDQGVAIAQIKDSEWAKPIGRALEFGVLGAAGWAMSHEWSNALQAVQPNISGSYNQPGGSMAGNDVSIPTTTTTTTTTNTETMSGAPIEGWE